jgi:uncharacterized alkaline shock family protein YloU
MIPLHSAAEGTAEISEQALSSLVRSAAAATPGIHPRRCRIETRPSPAPQPGGGQASADAADPGTHLIIRLRVAASAGIDIPRTAEALRDEISKVVPARVGIGAGRVDIIVEDLYDAR